ncbi:MAG: dipeptidase [Caldilineaceae bacterium SB0670_bin_27]|uniref:Dipeptidase n=1 Tax=Caldilineaceae bacterium SB0664_bin_27 TaxID=2605260 RepID=A0A6B0YZF8_9CHLR|nr:dipeptidase [Caldilineaceae bacterium SB0664_bin_27]MYJ78484.1 dipeptidase [Caldilineaceae bacterium SB0670_bin_27]
MASYQSYLEEHQDRFLAELIEFLRIPSISALPERAEDVARAGEWVAQRLTAAGVENVAVLPTDGHPVVYGDWLHATDRPTIMIYGHFDVQPVDPVELWTNPPFEPTVKGDRVYARGASDDKGNMLAPILAVEALLKGEGEAPVNLKFCFEGQEEIGSPNIPDFMPQHTERFACDLAVSADGGQFSETEPILLMSLRGVCGLQIDVHGATSDLHSGLHGGRIQNPIHALTQILGSLRRADGTVAVEGFYDDVVELTPDERAAVALVPFDGDHYLKDLGLEEEFGEPGYTNRERGWVRPTLEMNGIWGGFQEEGIKTVLPNSAHAKVTCRLVADQDPARIIALLKEHVTQHAPPGVRVEVTPLSILGRPYSISASHWGNRAAATVLKEMYGREPYQTRSGGSIPITGVFREQLGVDTISFGFGIEDENFHAPDEFFRLASFRKSQVAYCKLLAELGKSAPQM